MATLKRVGLVLMLVGAADIAYMVYTVAKGQSYSSSLNVFALLAGIILYRGSLTAARLVAHAAAFMLAGAFGAILLIPLVVPWDFLVISSRLQPASWALTAVTAGAIVAVLLWLRRQLTSGAVADAFESSGKLPPRTIISFALGMVVCLIAGLAVRAFLGGESAQEAMGRARQRVGPDYRFLVTNMSVTYGREGKRGQAMVLAYRPSEMRSVLVRFGSPRPETSPAADDASQAAVSSDTPTSAGPAEADAITATDAESYSRRAAAYGRAREYDKALADADAAMSIDPDRIETYVLADWILFQQQKWDEIISRWTRFIESHPTSGRAYFERGGAYHHKGDGDAARRDVEQACSLQHTPACQLLPRLGPPTAR